MPFRMFDDLVVSRPRPRGAGRARVLPFSVAVHGAAFAALAVAPSLFSQPTLVAVAAPPAGPIRYAPVEVRQPPPPVVVAPAPHVARTRAPRTTAPPVPTPATPQTFSTGPSVPVDTSKITPSDADSAAPACLHDCEPGANQTGIAIGVPGPPTDAGPPVVRRAGRDVKPPVKLGGRSPEYPELARVAHVEGEVVVECTIDPSGHVTNATVMRGNTLFYDAALDAIRTWTYRPTLVDDVPVPVLMTVTVRFRLS